MGSSGQGTATSSRQRARARAGGRFSRIAPPAALIAVAGEVKRGGWHLPWTPFRADSDQEGPTDLPSLVIGRTCERYSSVFTAGNALLLEAERFINN